MVDPPLSQSFTTRDLIRRDEMELYEFHIFTSGILRKRYYFNFESTNGEVMFQSEAYSRQIDAERAIGTIQREAHRATVIQDLDERK